MEISLPYTPPLGDAVHRKLELRLFYGAALYVLFYIGFTVASVLLPVTNNMAYALLSAIAGAWIAVLMVFYLVELFLRTDYSRKPVTFGVDTIASHIGFLLIMGIATDILYNRLALQYGDVSVGDRLWGAALCGLANLGVLVAATGAGLWVARGLRAPHYLIMAAVVGALTDIFSVYAGPSKHIVVTAAFPYMAYHWGLIGGGGVYPCVGIGDFIFLALYLAGTGKFGLNGNRTLLAMCAAFAAGFATLLISPQGIPALPFMSAALLATHWKALKGAKC